MHRIFLFITLFLSSSLLYAQQWETVDSEPLFEKQTFTIAIVQDGPSNFLDKLNRAVQKEVELLVKEEFNVRFKRSNAFNGDWTQNGVAKALKNALADPEINLVYTAGVMGTREAASQEMDLDKPVMGGVILDTNAIDLPFDKDEWISNKKNFSFVISPAQVSRDLEAFSEIVPFKKLHVIVDKNLFYGMSEQMQKNIALKEKEFGIEFELLPIRSEASEVLNQLDDSVEAVYITPTFTLSEIEKQVLIEGLNNRNIPTFSIFGVRDVQRGVLGGFKGDNMLRLSRRIALSIQQIMMGDSIQELKVYLPVDDLLLLNAKTANQIGFFPDFKILREAEILYKDELVKGEYLTLDRTIEIASKNNIDLAIAKASVEDARQQQYQAFSFMLPQAESNVKYSLIDNDRARASSGTESRTTTGFSAKQVVFDDQVYSNVRSSIRNYQGELYEQKTVQYDVIETASKRFLDYLSTEELYNVEVENLKLTQKNLELANIRESVGTAGPEEAYRWKAQEANQKASVNNAATVMEQARVALNQSLGLDQHTYWDLRAIFLDDEDFYFLDNKIFSELKNQKELTLFRRFVVEQAFDNAPELKALGKAIEAQTIRVNQLKRRFVLPTASAFVDYDYELEEKNFIPADAEQPDKEDWLFGVSVTYPLFEGGRKIADVKQAKAQLDGLKQTHERARQLIEQRAQSALYSLESSHPNIRLNRIAADQAQKNLDVVQKKYAQGLVPIIDLLDAQNQSFTQNQAAAIAVNEYLKDLMEFERSIAWFEPILTEEEKETFLNQFQTFMAQGKE